MEVLFSPTSATRHDVNLILRTSLNQSYRLHVTAQGLEPPVLLSHTVGRTRFSHDRALQHSQ